MPLHIKDGATAELVARLAKRRGVSKLAVALNLTFQRVAGGKLAIRSPPRLAYRRTAPLPPSPVNQRVPGRSAIQG